MTATSGIASYLQLHFLRSLIGGEPRQIEFTIGLIFWFVCLILPHLASPAFQQMVTTLSERLTLHVNLRLLELDARIITLDAYSDQEYRNCIKVVADGVKTRPTNSLVSLTYLFRDVFSVIGIVVYTLQLAPVLALVASATFFIQSWALMKFRDQSWELILGRTDESRRLDYLMKLGLEVEFAEERKSYRTEKWLADEYIKGFNRAQTSLWTERYRGLLQLYAFVGTSAVLLAVALFYATGTLMTGGAALAITLQAMMQLYMASTGVADNFTIFSQRSLYFKEFQRLIDFDSKYGNDEYKDSTFQEQRLERLCMKNIKFQYGNIETLRGIDLTLRSGEAIALVGENGAGKSTAIKLLLQLYKPTSGALTYNEGENTDNMPISYWRSRIGYVKQNPLPYSLTLLQNVAFGVKEDDVDQSRVLVALCEAGCMDFVERMGIRLESVLGKEFGGQELSGGQLQRLSIARAIYRNPDILIFDEPNSALDAFQERQLWKLLNDLSKDRICLFITHRLNAAKVADRIAVFQHGVVAESGSHDELITLGGVYAEMWSVQAHSYQ